MGFEKDACYVLGSDGSQQPTSATYAVGDVRTLREWLDVNFKGMSLVISSPRESGWMTVPIATSGEITHTRHGNLIRMHMKWMYVPNGPTREELLFFREDERYRLELVRGDLRLANIDESCCVLM